MDAAPGPPTDDLPSPADAPREQPVTIAEAAQRAGLHPNTVRRFIRQGQIGAMKVKGTHGDTWIVDAAELERVAAAPRRHGPSPGSVFPPRFGPAFVDAPGSPAMAPDHGIRAPYGAAATTPPGARGVAALSGSLDLSLDRAQALQQYTHALIAPLVELVRDREAALERRETLVRHQAERIGRLERELELLRARLAAVARTVRSGLGTAAASEPAIGALDASGSGSAEGGPGTGQPAMVDVSGDVVLLASRAERLRQSLNEMASSLEEKVALARTDKRPTFEQPVGDAAWPDDVAPSEPGDEPTPGEHQGPTPGHATPFPSGVERARGEAPALAESKGEDPFLQAEVAIQELQKAFAAQALRGRDGGERALPAADWGETMEPTPANGTGSVQAAPVLRPLVLKARRRPWWRPW